MKHHDAIITDVRTAVLRIPLSDEVRDSQSSIDSWWMTVAIVKTDTGITGWGYNSGITPGLKAVKTLIDEVISPKLIGQNAFAVRELWAKVYERPYFLGESGIAFQGIAAVEIALWDIVAKSLEQPLWKVLGESSRERIPAYNTDVGWLSLSANGAAERSRRAIDAGFCGVKIKVGAADLKFDVCRVQQVRRAIGNQPRLLVDANCKWDEHTAAHAVHQLEEYNLHCVEEPLHPFDVLAHARLAEQVDVPLMLGESITSYHLFRDLIAANALGILQPDVLKLGGISSWLAVASLATKHRMPLVPAVWDMMQVQIHLSAIVDDVVMMEYIPWITHVFEQPVKLDNGCLRVPQEPGSGTEIRREALERYAVS